MTKTESAEHTVKTLAIESCEQWLNFKMSAGVRAAIPGTNKLIMVGPADWIAKNVPDVEVLIAAAEKPAGDLTDERNRVREEFELAIKLGARFDIDSAMLNVDALMRTALAGQSQATKAQAVPEGWESLSIVYNEDMTYPEEVAYGPPHMMKRLGKWLDKFMAQQIALRDGMVMAPHFRGYAHLGIGAYVINHSAKGEPAELVISIATDEEKAGRTVGDSRDNAPDAMLHPEAMAVRLRFENVAGLDALEQQLRFVRSEHFAESAAQEVTQQAAPESWISVDDEQKPEVGKPVLLFVRTAQHGEDDNGHSFTTEGEEVAMGEYCWPKGWDAGTGYFDCYTSPMSDNDWITHWMPLPSAPEQPGTAGATKGGEDKPNSSDLAPTTSTVSAPDELEQAARLCEEMYESGEGGAGTREAAKRIRALRTNPATPASKGEA